MFKKLTYLNVGTRPDRIYGGNNCYALYTIKDSEFEMGVSHWVRRYDTRATDFVWGLVPEFIWLYETMDKNVPANLALLKCYLDSTRVLEKVACMVSSKGEVAEYFDCVVNKEEFQKYTQSFQQYVDKYTLLI